MALGRDSAASSAGAQLPPRRRHTASFPPRLAQGRGGKLHAAPAADRLDGRFNGRLESHGAAQERERLLAGEALREALRAAGDGERGLDFAAGLALRERERLAGERLQLTGLRLLQRAYHEKISRLSQPKTTLKGLQSRWH